MKSHSIVTNYHSKTFMKYFIKSFYVTKECSKECFFFFTVVTVVWYTTLYISLILFFAFFLVIYKSVLHWKTSLTKFESKFWCLLVHLLYMFPRATLHSVPFFTNCAFVGHVFPICMVFSDVSFQKISCFHNISTLFTAFVLLIASFSQLPIL